MGVNSKTILDLILVTDSEKMSQSGVLGYGVSDDMITYCTRKCTKVPHGQCDL